MALITTAIVGYTCMLAILVYAIKLYMSRRQYVNQVNLLPGLKTVWPFGNVLPFLKIPFKDYSDKYMEIMREARSLGDIQRWWIFNVPYVSVITANAAEVLLKSGETHKSIEYDLFCRWLGRGLITSSGVLWQAHRKMLTRSFHFEILESFISVFNEQSIVLTNQLRNRDSGEEFNIFPFISVCSLDIICETAMGKKLNAQTSVECEYLEVVKTLSELVIQKSVKIWLQIPWIYMFTSSKRKEDACLKVAHGFINKVISERRAERKVGRVVKAKSDDNCESEVFGKKRTLAFLDTLLEAVDNGHGYLSNEEIREEVDTFMFAGHDTTASTLTSTIMNIGMYPEVQALILEEMKSIFGDSDRDVAIEDLPRMKYLEAVIKETLRLYPPVPLYGRILKDDLKIGSHVIPRDTRVFVVANIVHRDPRHYPNPSAFDPTRFLATGSEEIGPRHPFAFLAFSAGFRNCIGQKYAMMMMKIVLTHLVRNFRIIYTDERRNYKMAPGVVSRPRKGLRVCLEHRLK